MPSQLEIGPESCFSTSDIAVVARSTATISLSPAAVATVLASRKIVDTHAMGPAPVYGLNTGLGANLKHRLSSSEIVKFQSQIVLGRNIGMGEPLPIEVCRAALLSRIVSATKGTAGLSLETLQALISLWNAGVTPAIPSIGSIGASDLGLSAHMAAVLLGRGEAWSNGQLVPGQHALVQAGLAPIDLQPKDGLALCNNNAVTCGMAAMVLDDAVSIFAAAIHASGLAFAAYGANANIFTHALHATRPARGQQEMAQAFAHVVKGVAGEGKDVNIQDAICYRTLAPVFGTFHGSVVDAIEATEVEINGVHDSPIVLLQTGEMLSSPNFHTARLALAFDTLAIVVAQVATATCHRVFKLMTPQYSGLQKYLSPVGGASAGFVPLQKTIAALHAEIRQDASPASLDTLAVSETVEDHAPNTLLCIRKFARQIKAFEMLTAIEAMVAAQAADLRTGLQFGPVLKTFQCVVRNAVSTLEEDRETGPDAMRVVMALQNSERRTELRAALTPMLPAVANSSAFSRD